MTATPADVAAVGTAASATNGGDEAHGQLGEAPPAPMAPTAMEVCTILQGCSAVVGMHPDAATESIVDFALAAGKPVAVVPCCRESSRERRVGDGVRRHGRQYSSDRAATTGGGRGERELS